jgi:type IV pilus assembly protein PilA
MWRDKLKKNKGFSLLELLIVVAIILIIATIAIPSLMRSRQSANESSAVANIRNLNTAEVTYSSANHSTYADIPELIALGLLDDRYGNAQFNGYRFTVALSSGSRNYTAYATGVSTNTSRYDYFSSPDFVIRYTTVATRAPAGMNGDPVLSF